MTITPEAVFELLKNGGLAAVCAGLVYAVVSLIKGKVVVRPWYDAMVESFTAQLKERDDRIETLEEEKKTLTQLAYRGTELAERTAKAAIAPERKD